MANNSNKSTAVPGKGMENVKEVEDSKKREAGFPGGEENAAGADAKERPKREKEGSQPVPSESLNYGNKK